MTWQEKLITAVPQLTFQQGVSMASCTTLRLGGPAALLCEPDSPEAAQAVLRAAAAQGVPVTVLGHGSNLLVRDGGIDGLVLRIGPPLARASADGDTLVAEAGISLGALARFAAAHGLAGLAFAAGIPGTLGGGALMNAGAYGGEMSQVITRVEGYRMDGRSFYYNAADMAYAYRHSRLMEESCVITQVHLRLPPGQPADILAEMEDLAKRRAEKQPLSEHSAGSTFKRPKDGYAAALIDQCGLKGLTVGGASVSEKHAGFLINRGGTAADFLALMQKVQERVYQQTGIRLEPEVQIVGTDKGEKGS